MGMAIISILELIYDKSRKGNLLKKLNNRGRSIILIALFSILFNFFRDYKADLKQVESDKENARKDSLFQSKQLEILELQNSTKETIIKKVDSTYIKSIKASNQALAKYNLVITDSLHSVIRSLELNPYKAQLSIAPVEKGNNPAFLTKDKDKNKLNIKFRSRDGTSYHINLKCYLLLKNKIDDYSILNSMKIGFGESFLVDNVERTKIIDISPSILLYSEIMVYITGTFSQDPERKRIIPFDDSFIFNFKDNIYISGQDVEYIWLKKQLNIK